MNPNAPSRSFRSRPRWSWGSIAILALIVLYWFIQPVLNERYGWNLPQLQSGSQETSPPSELPSEPPSEPPSASREAPRQTPRTPEHSAPSSANNSEASTEKGRSRNTGDAAAEDAPRKDLPRTNSRGEEPLRDDFLRATGGDRFLSPAGLIYGPGSQEGHRLKHLQRHLADIPDRPGSHGVFDGQLDDALRWIDTAYERGQRGGSGVNVDREEGRTVYTVNLGQRIGYIGGAEGKRRGNPPARRLRLVLEGNRLITAFPL